MRDKINILFNRLMGKKKSDGNGSAAKSAKPKKTKNLIQNLRDSLELFHEAVLVVDLSMKVRYANMLARKFNYMDSMECRGNISDIHVNKLLQENIEGHHVTIRALNTGIMQSEEIKLELDGQFLEFIYNCIPYYDYVDGTAGAILLLTNISQLRAMQKVMEKAAGAS